MHQEVKDRRIGTTKMGCILWSTAVIVIFALIQWNMREEPNSGDYALLEPELNHTKICVLMAAQHSDGMNLFTSATSLLTSESPNVAIVLIGTDRASDKESQKWLANVASTINKLYNSPRVVVANITQASVDTSYPAFRDNFENNMDYG